MGEPIQKTFIELHHDRPRDPSLYEPYVDKHWPKDAAEVEQRLRDRMKKYPLLTESEASLMLIYEGTAAHSAIIQGSDGGGAYPKFLSRIRHKLKP